MDAIKPYEESSQFKDSKCNCTDDKGLVFTQSIYGCPSSAKEIEDAFQTVGIMVRAKINRLWNEGEFDKAKELEEALIKINTADYNH